MVPAPRAWMPVAMSILERIVSRGSTAILTLLLAIFTTPDLVGVYATVILAMTLYQSLTDGVIRQIGVECWNYGNARSFIRKASLISAGTGLILVSGAVWFVTQPTHSLDVLLKLAPLAIVPIVTAAYLGVLTKAQRSPSGWTRIAKAQSLAGISSLAIGIPLLPVIDIGAASLQLLAAESIFLLLLRRHPTPEADHRGLAPLWRRYYLPTALSSVLGWSQSQLERLILVLLSAPGPVGMYSLAIAVARSASDAITSGLVNAIRSEISTASSLESRQGHLRRGISIGIRVSILMQVAITIGCVYVLPLVLDASWAPALSAAPVFAVTGVFAAISWVVSAYIISSGESKRLITAQVIGILLSVGCGYALNISLTFGALVCALRDGIGLCLRLYIVRHSLDSLVATRIFVLLVLSVCIGTAPLLFAFRL